MTCGDAVGLGAVLAVDPRDEQMNSSQLTRDFCPFPEVIIIKSDSAGNDIS
jgi:hypothetical protein